MSNECWWHGYEPVPPGAYIVCGECWHAYATADDLLDAARRIGYRARTAELIFSCPLCAHDF